MPYPTSASGLDTQQIRLKEASLAPPPRRKPWIMSQLYHHTPPGGGGTVGPTHKSPPRVPVPRGYPMAEGLVRRMADYAQENGHFLSRVIWYNSTTTLWASSDTLQYFIHKYHPTFIMACIGGNEQFVKDLHAREECIHKIIGTFGDTPFIWIGVPTWKEDTGLNSLIQKCVGENRFFDSRKLTLKRGSDRVHPTFVAASMWMDSIAAWMQDKYPIQMQKPHKKATHKFPLHLLQPVK